MGICISGHAQFAHLVFSLLCSEFAAAAKSDKKNDLVCWLLVDQWRDYDEKYHLWNQKRWGNLDRLRDKTHSIVYFDDRLSTLHSALCSLPHFNLLLFCVVPYGFSNQKFYFTDRYGAFCKLRRWWDEFVIYASRFLKEAFWTRSLQNFRCSIDNVESYLKPAFSLISSETRILTYCILKDSPKILLRPTNQLLSDKVL